METEKNILYIEASSGISGDMFVAALLDLGKEDPAMENGLNKVLSSIPVEGFTTSISRKIRAGIDVCDFDVKPDHGYENHDHDMEYLYGHSHPHEHTDDNHHPHEHTHHSGSVHSHPHEHTDDDHYTHDHVHRGLKEVSEILCQTALSDGARTLAQRIFEILAKAESQAHGVPMDEVHFHEVGAVDSIVDIVAAAYCMDYLSPERVIVSPLTEGQGSVRTQHGVLPVPVPAVTHIVANEGLILRQKNMTGELVTPTGAAIAAAIRTENNLPDNYSVHGIGIGGGKRDYEPPSMVRAMWIMDAGEKKECDTICRLETDIDDCTGEDLGYVMEKLYEAGAREVHFTPIFMKKNRPAYELTVITTADLREKLELIIFKETTTIGIRRQWMERTILPRKSVTEETLFGPVTMKEVTLPDGEVRRYPEYESLKQLAEKRDIPIGRLRDEIHTLIPGARQSKLPDV
ncbi:MAG: nickel pincer cofactor biosynthesis protein LarC [Eubacterium sp.]|nr:nickel pincer cofactor biosynthesis protein LarC [Eubacterium sp.]